jgi:ribonuclease HI
MEGHIKYLLGKYSIAVGRSFDQFDKSPSGAYVLRPELSIPAPHNGNIEMCYNFYVNTRHKVFHFGDIIGVTDNTYLVKTKDEADEIIREAIKLINLTVY